MSPTKKIEKLTPRQEQRLAEVYQEWLAIGRCTAPINRVKCKKIIDEFYSRIGKQKPTIFYFSSPALCILAYSALQILSKNGIKGQLWDQLGTQLGDQLWDQIVTQLGDQLWGQLRTQLWDQLWTQLGDQLSDQIVTQLRTQLWGQLRTQLGDQLWDQLVTQLGDQLGDQLIDQIVTQLRDQLWDQLVTQLRDQLSDQIVTQLEDQLWGQLRTQLGDQLWDQIVTQLRDQLSDQIVTQLGDQLSNHFAGAHWCAWEVFYNFCSEIGVKYNPENENLLDLWIEQSKELQWWFPFNGIVFVSDRHTIVEVDSEGRLHSDKGQACGYSDKWGIWAWHGIRVEQRIIENPETITAKEILSEQNAEIRRIMIERMGMERFIIDAKAKEIHAHDRGTLFSIDLPNDPENVLKAVRVTCPSTGRKYFLRVPPQINRADDAVAWTFGFDLTKEYVPIAES